MTRYTFSLLIALVALSFTHPTALTSYASFKGSKHGQFEGQTPGKGGREKDGWFEVQSFKYDEISPRDAATGQTSGKRQHSPVVIVKEMDAASPLLYDCLASKEVLQVVIQTLDDQKKISKTVTLTNAVVADLKRTGNIETISFNYEQTSMRQ